MAAHTDNSIFIAAPLDLTWALANDLSRWQELFGNEYSSVETLEGGPGWVTFRITTRADESGRVRSWVSQRFLDAQQHRVWARRIQADPFLYMHIFQSFDPLPGGVRLRWIQDFELLPGRGDDERAAARINDLARANLRHHRQIIEGAASALRVPVKEG
jgi:aromatase